MSRYNFSLALWLSIVLPAFVLQGCSSHTVGSSSSKLEHWVPQDAWKNQKAGTCCFVYERPAPPPQMLTAQPMPDAPPAVTPHSVATEPAPAVPPMPSRDVAKELADAQAALAAKEVENAALTKLLETAKADLASRASADVEKAELTKQLQEAKAEVAVKSTLEDEKRELARQLEAARAESRRLQASDADATVRLGQDNEKADLRRQLQEARTALSTRSVEESQAAELAKQLEAARAELAGKAALENDKAELAKSLDDARAALAQKTAREQELDRAIKSMEEALKKEIKEGSGSVRRGENSFTVELTESILYDSGSADIKPEGVTVLQRIAESLKHGGERMIRVEGHTDDVPIRKSPPPRFRSNWLLSVARAVGVVEYLEKTEGIKPSELSAAGYSLTRPAVPNENDQARGQNRRVEIIVTPGSTSAMAPAQ